jgi:hypothetical protein
MASPALADLLATAVLVLQSSLLVILGAMVPAVFPAAHGNRRVLLAVRRFAGWSALLTLGSGASVALLDSPVVPTGPTSWIPLLVTAPAGAVAVRVGHLLRHHRSAG